MTTYDLQGSVGSASHRSATETITGPDGDRTGNAWAGHRSNHGDFHAGTTGDAAVAAGRAARAALARRRRGPLLLLRRVLAGRGNGLPQNDWSFFSWEAYQLFRASTPAFEQLAAFQIGEANARLTVRRAGSPVPVATANGEYVSCNFFETFRISAWRGRFFTNADDREAAPPVTVMSFHAWQGKYGSDPSVVGATYDLNGRPFTIIGIAPPGFFGAKVA